MHEDDRNPQQTAAATTDEADEAAAALLAGALKVSPRARLLVERLEPDRWGGKQAAGSFRPFRYVGGHPLVEVLRPFGGGRYYVRLLDRKPGSGPGAGRLKFLCGVEPPVILGDPKHFPEQPPPGAAEWRPSEPRAEASASASAPRPAAWSEPDPGGEREADRFDAFERGRERGADRFETLERSLRRMEMGLDALRDERERAYRDEQLRLQRQALEQNQLLLAEIRESRKAPAAPPPGVTAAPPAPTMTPAQVLREQMDSLGATVEFFDSCHNVLSAFHEGRAPAAAEPPAWLQTAHTLGELAMREIIKPAVLMWMQKAAQPPQAAAAKLDSAGAPIAYQTPPQPAPAPPAPLRSASGRNPGAQKGTMSSDGAAPGNAPIAQRAAMSRHPQAKPAARRGVRAEKPIASPLTRSAAPWSPAPKMPEAASRPRAHDRHDSTLPGPKRS